MAAVERADVDAMTSLLREDAGLTMPPNPFWFAGRAASRPRRAGLSSPLPRFMGAGGTCPPAPTANPRRELRPRPGTGLPGPSLDVLRFGDGRRIAEITSFEPHLFPVFGLPLRL